MSVKLEVKGRMLPSEFLDYLRALEVVEEENIRGLSPHQKFDTLASQVSAAAISIIGIAGDPYKQASLKDTPALRSNIRALTDVELETAVIEAAKSSFSFRFIDLLTSVGSISSNASGEAALCALERNELEIFRFFAFNPKLTILNSESFNRIVQLLFKRKEIVLIKEFVGRYNRLINIEDRTDFVYWALRSGHSDIAKSLLRNAKISKSSPYFESIETRLKLIR